jgi:ribulose-5-phosphate 4-epimerase/fuculose-1-phosphate aldolase
VAKDELSPLRRTLALACRILAFQGLAEGILGHVSARVDEDRILIRCRGPRERGLLFTQPGDIRLLDLSADQRSDGNYSAPNELPIHIQLLRADHEVNAVVHAHPPAVVAADLAGIPLVPMVGAYNIPAARMAAAGVPVFGRSVLIQTDELARDMVDAMRGRQICVLRGHGIATVGATVQQAVARALNLDSLARMACRIAAVGAIPVSIPTIDLEALPDLGGAFNDDALWRHHVGRLDHAGLGIPV